MWVVPYKRHSAQETTIDNRQIMNRKKYCAPATIVTKSVCRSTLMAASGPNKLEEQSLGIANESTTTKLNLNGSNAWSSEDNKEDEEFDF